MGAPSSALLDPRFQQSLCCELPEVVDKRMVHLAARTSISQIAIKRSTCTAFKVLAKASPRVTLCDRSISALGHSGEGQYSAHHFARTRSLDSNHLIYMHYSL
jgi:hypothetical protein